MVVVTNTQSLVKVGSKICHKHAVLDSKCAKFKLQGAAARRMGRRSSKMTGFISS